MDKKVIERAKKLAHRLQKISINNHGNEVMMEFTLEQDGKPQILGNFGGIGVPDLSLTEKIVYHIHTHSSECTFTRTDLELLRRIAKEKILYSYMFVATPNNLHCLYRTKDSLQINYEKLNEIAERGSKEFQETKGISLERMHTDSEYRERHIDSLDLFTGEKVDPLVCDLLKKTDGLEFKILRLKM